MFTIWFRYSNVDALPSKAEVHGLRAAQLVWDSLINAGFIMISTRP